jgi:beta-galactosidase
MFKLNTVIRVAAFILFCFFYLSVNAQTAILNSGTRTQNFDRNWKFCKGDKSNAQLNSFNDASWETINVPHEYAISQSFVNDSGLLNAGYLDQSTIGWYRKIFRLSSKLSGKKIMVAFDGIYNNSKIWINGILLGKKGPGNISFQYDLTPYLKFGSEANVLAVQVNPSTTDNTAGTWWYNGCGIFRHVWLVICNPIHLKNWGTFITTPVVSTNASVNIKTEVVNESNASSTVTLISEIVNKNGVTVQTGKKSYTIPARAQYQFDQTLGVDNAELWSIDTPVLYKLRSKVLVGMTRVDMDSTNFGIREIRFDANQGLFLNGKSAKIKGVNMHNDLGCLGAAVSNQGIRRRLELLKSMGCNAIRTSHNPPAPELLDYCDKMGFLVDDEGSCRLDLNPAHDSLHAPEVNDWICRDRNHPSVIMWSLSNEDEKSVKDERGAETYKKRLAWGKALDPTRAFTWAMNLYLTDPKTASIAALLDAAGMNYCIGDCAASNHSANPTFKLFLSEAGCTFRSRGIYHWPTDSIFSQTSDNQGSEFDNQYTWSQPMERAWIATKAQPFLAGLFMWSGFDYIGEPSPYSWPNRSSSCGIFDLCGFPKEIYWGLRSQWRAEPLVHILPHWNWASGIKVPLWTYTNCENVELFLNGTSLGAKDVDCNKQMHVEWKDVEWVPGTLVAVGKIGGVAVAFDTIRTAEAPAKIQCIADRSAIFADGYDVIFLETNILDAIGTIVPTASNKITFTVEGPGAVIATDNGDPTDHDLFTSSSRKAFNGKCLAVVQSKNNWGKITVTATSPGITSTSITFKANDHDAKITNWK